MTSRREGRRGCEYNAWLHLDVISGGGKRSKLFGQDPIETWEIIVQKKNAQKL